MFKLSQEEDFVNFLIEKVHQTEYMWNMRNPCYKNKLKRQQFWLKLVNELNEKFKPGVPFTYNKVLRKWNNLKSYFSMENQKMLKAQRSGTVLDENLSTWKYKSQMDFLSSTVDHTISVNNFYKRSSDIFESEENLLPNKFELLSESNSSETIDKSIAPACSIPMLPSCSSSPISFIEINEIKLEKSLDLTENLDTSKSSFVPLHRNKKSKTISRTSVTSEDASRSISQSQSQELSYNTAESTNSVFGNCIAVELDKLAPDLLILGKKQIFSLIMHLQEEQIKRDQ